MKRTRLMIVLLLLGAWYWVEPGEGSGEEGFRLIFPQFADGQDERLMIRSSVVLINNSTYETAGHLTFLRDDGSPFEVSTSWGTGSTFGFSLQAGESRRLVSTGSGPLRKGWATAVSDAPLTGAGSFGLFNSSAQIISEVGIGDSPPATRQLLFVDVAEGKNSGFAICNPDPLSSVTLDYRLRAMDGQTLAVRSEVLSPLTQVAKFVTEVFDGINLEGIKGVLEVQSSLPVSLVTLRTRDVNFTSLPSVRIDSQSEKERVTYLPRLGEGIFGNLGFQTAVFLLNGSDEDRTAELEFFGEAGSPMALSLQGSPKERREVHLPANGAVEMVTSSENDPGQVGWGRLVVPPSAGGGATLVVLNSRTGGFVSEVGIPTSAPVAQPVVHVASPDTGIALSNPIDEALTLELSLYENSEISSLLSWFGTASGRRVSKMVAQTVLQVPPRGHVGKYVREFLSLPEAGFEGRLQCAAYVSRYGPDVSAPLVPIALLSRGSRLTSQPAAGLANRNTLLSYWDERADTLRAAMTLEEKIGQMTQADISFILSDDDVSKYFLGSVLSGGSSDPPSNDPVAWADLYDWFQSKALATRLGIPLLYGVDAVHGHSNVTGAVIFPHNIGLGATRNPELVRRVAQVTASEMRATGLNWNFAPCVAVPRDERWGRTYEGFGETPELVRTMARAAVLGYEGAGLNSPLSVLACAKHFIGDGGTAFGTGLPIDQGDTVLDEDTLRAIHLPGYLGAMEAGVGTIMVSFSSWNGTKLSGHRYLLSDLLKGELGFEGFLVSDWGAIDQLPGDYRADVKAAINAGLDMIMVPDKYQEFFVTLKDLVERGEIPLSRIDDAVRRILRVKLAAGLIDRTPVANRDLMLRFGSDGHRELARQAVRESAVLLKNAGEVLPLADTSGRIHVAGKNADDLGNQCGGWTIDWQGRSGRITEGTTILEGMREVAPPGVTVTFSKDGSGAAGSDTVVLVLGERPYAEMLGDVEELSLPPEDLAAFNNVRESGVPAVVILVTGRPLILEPILEEVEAVLTVWLPGSEGAGVADVLFGHFAPVGTLPCTWPATTTQLPINEGDPDYAPLFPYGFGLSY